MCIIYICAIQHSSQALFFLYSGRVWENTSIRYKVLLPSIYYQRCYRLEYRRPLDGIADYCVLTKYTNVAFICILLSPLLAEQRIFSPLRCSGRANLKPTLSPLARVIRVRLRAPPLLFFSFSLSLSAGFNLNEFR